jgi:hypothetical protein
MGEGYRKNRKCLEEGNDVNDEQSSMNFLALTDNNFRIMISFAKNITF